MSNKMHAFVLCHSILHNAFRSDRYRTNGNDLEAFKKWCRARFLSDFITIFSATVPEGQYVAFTSERVYNDFVNKLEQESSFRRLDEFLRITENVIFVVKEEKINALDINEGIIAIASKLAETGNYDTFVITDMKRKKLDVARDFYDGIFGNGDFRIPFDIISVEESIGFVRGRFPEIYDKVVSTDTLYNSLHM